MASPNNGRNNVTCGVGGLTAERASPEGVGAWQERLWESLVAFEAVQLEHRNAFAGGNREHLMTRRAEREKALARLQMALAAAQPELHAVQDGEYAKRLRAKFSTLIENETTLAHVTLTLRKQMVDELATMQRGKRVLQGYSQHHGSSPPPRFLNSKT